MAGLPRIQPSAMGRWARRRTLNNKAGSNSTASSSTSCLPWRRAVGPLALAFAFLMINYVVRWDGAAPSSSYLVGLLLKGKEETTPHNVPTDRSGLHQQLAQLRQVPLEARASQDFPDYRPAVIPPRSIIDPTRTIAHAVSLIRCPTQGDATQKFLDALMALRHSIHLNSAHNAASNSTYYYQMYAFVHEDNCARPHPNLPSLLKRLGYLPVVVSNPVSIQDEVPDGYYKRHVEQENCCGSDEFIKLYAYTLTNHPIFVHWDLDALLLQPMDDLLDAMLHPASSIVGRSARSRIRIQHPTFQKLPDTIDAFFTRDVTSSAPWELVQAVQGGFLVARPNLSSLEIMKALIRSGNYTRGRGPGSGWGGMGYGGFQGAMAYQGVLAYFFDVLYPHRHVELDVCRWNQVAADVVWRGPGKDANGNDHLHECRDYPRYTHNFTTNTPESGACEDCRATPIEETMSVHYTACFKPFECRAWKPRRGPKDQQYRIDQIANATTCSLLTRQYFMVRRHVEFLIAEASGTRAKVFQGPYHPETFLGYCSSLGGYQPMEPLPEGFDMKQVYGF